MKTLPLIAALGALVASAPACAEVQTFDVPGEGWRLTLDAPHFTGAARAPSLFSGNAGRWNVSFFVDRPRCDGEDSAENAARCFLRAHENNPTVVRDSVRASRLGDRVLVVWGAALPYEGRTYRQLNANVLFTRKGKWVDLHLSIIEPEQADLARLQTVVDSVKVEDVAP